MFTALLSLPPLPLPQSRHCSHSATAFLSLAPTQAIDQMDVEFPDVMADVSRVVLACVCVCMPCTYMGGGVDVEFPEVVADVSWMCWHVCAWGGRVHVHACMCVCMCRCGATEGGLQKGVAVLHSNNKSNQTIYTI